MSCNSLRVHASRKSRRLSVAALLVAAGSAFAQHGDVDALLSRIATFQHGDSREALGRFSVLVFDSMGSQAQMRDMEARLLKFVESKPTPAARDFALEQLTFVATEKSVPLLRSLVSRSDTVEQARFLLERIPGPAASEALRNGFASATGNVKIGIINSLGRRRDTGSVGVIAALITASNESVTEAALAALAGIADSAAVASLAEARNKLTGTLREEASEAYAECADAIAKRGHYSAAAKMYRELINARETAGVRIRAMAGLTALEGKNALPILTGAIHSKDRKEQSAGIAFLNRIPGADSTKAMAAEFPKSAPGVQVRLLAALADRGDAAVKPLALAALKSTSGEVRAAAFSALGKLGDESTVVLLAEAAAERPGPEQDAARQSLWGLRGSNIDPVIVEGIGAKHGKVRTELILTAGERGITSAADSVAKTLDNGDSETRRAALRALRNIGSSAQLASLLDSLAKATSSERRDATQTLGAVIRRSDSGAIDQVLSAYRAAPSTEVRVSLLEVMGQSSNNAALPVLRANLNDPNPEIARGAILALSSWESPSALNDLYAIAKDGSDPALKILALRGYIKQIGLRSARPVSDSVSLLSSALQLAKEAAEKRSVLALLPSYPSPQSLELAEGLLRDETVANEAKAAVTRLRSAIGQQ